MIFYKILYHINAIIVLAVMRIFYTIGGGKLIIGKHFTFRRGFSLMIDKHAEVVIGNNVFFNNYCSVNANESITIGDGTIFGENVRIYDHNHKYRDVDTAIKEQGFTSAPVVIGKHCWIASDVIILKGVHIGDNCVVGAGCVIYKDVPASTIVVNKQDLELKHI